MLVASQNLVFEPSLLRGSTKAGILDFSTRRGALEKYE
jgi:hypothetical protein